MGAIDKLIAQVEGEILDERIKVYKLKTALGKQWAKKRAGLTKRLYNLLERVSGLEILKIAPKSKILHDVEVWGFDNIINGKSINRIALTSVEGLSERYIDLFQIAEMDGMGLELKSESTTLKSVEGGLKDTEMKALFRSSSSIKKQIAKEKKIIAFAKKYGLVIVLKGKNVLTGAFEEVLFVPENIHTTRIISYRKIPDKILSASIPKPTLKSKPKPATDLKPKPKTPDSAKTKVRRGTAGTKASPHDRGVHPDPAMIQPNHVRQKCLQNQPSLPVRQVVAKAKRYQPEEKVSKLLIQS